MLEKIFEYLREKSAIIKINVLLNVSVSTLEDLSFVSAEETIADLNDFEEFDFDIGKFICILKLVFFSTYF